MNGAATTALTAGQVSIGDRIVIDGVARRVLRKQFRPPRYEDQDRSVTLWLEGLGAPLNGEESKTVHVMAESENEP